MLVELRGQGWPWTDPGPTRLAQGQGPAKMALTQPGLAPRQCMTNHFPVCDDIHTGTKAHQHRVLTGTPTGIQGIGVKLFRL